MFAGILFHASFLYTTESVVHNVYYTLRGPWISVIMNFHRSANASRKSLSEKEDLAASRLLNELHKDMM